MNGGAVLTRMWTCLVALLGMVMCVVPLTVRAEEPPAFLLQWGTGGAGDGTFGVATGIAVSTTGFVYVVDSSRDRVQKFTTDSVFVSKWGTTGSGPGQFDNPIDVAVDPAGNVYVADLFNSRIQKFDANGNYITEWGPMYGTLGVDPSGSLVYVVAGNKIMRFTTNGAFVSEWTFGVNPDTEFRGIGFGLDGSLYVVSKSYHLVAKFSADGALVTTWGSFGTGDLQFDTPWDVVVDQDGNVLVTDNRSVRKFTPDGAFLTRWGGLNVGSGPGQFNGALGIATDVDGNTYVLDTGNDRVQKFGEAPTPVLRTTWGRIKAIYR